MTRTKEEKELRAYFVRKWNYHSIDSDEKTEMLHAVTALVRATREDAIQVYNDWLNRPTMYQHITFPEALRKGLRWHDATKRRGKC